MSRLAPAGAANAGAGALCGSGCGAAIADGQRAGGSGYPVPAFEGVVKEAKSRSSTICLDAVTRCLFRAMSLYRHNGVELANNLTYRNTLAVAQWPCSWLCTLRIPEGLQDGEALPGEQVSGAGSAAPSGVTEGRKGPAVIRPGIGRGEPLPRSPGGPTAAPAVTGAVEGRQPLHRSIRSMISLTTAAAAPTIAARRAVLSSPRSTGLFLWRHMATSLLYSSLGGERSGPTP